MSLAGNLAGVIIGVRDGKDWSKVNSFGRAAVYRTALQQSQQVSKSSFADVCRHG